ncbi:MAG: hypothetical protein IJX17_01665, partial [Clostridia bacterium]|nr:hypothetical protein [Clostridia bacterium]
SLDSNYIYYETTFIPDDPNTPDVDESLLDKSDVAFAEYAETYYWEFDPYYGVNDNTTRVPSWYDHIGWYVQIDQKKHYVINDEYYTGYDTAKSDYMSVSQASGYFNKNDIPGYGNYHEFVYEYTNMKGEIATGKSQFYYYTNQDTGKVIFTFTHAFTDIYVYAVYKMVEYDMEVTIDGDYGSTYWTSNGTLQTNSPVSGIESVTLNDDIDLSDSYNTNSITYADRVNYKGTYREPNSKFPLYIGATGSDLVSYTPTLFTYSNNYGHGANGTDNSVETENNQNDDDSLFRNNDLECGRRAYDEFKYHTNVNFTVTTVQNNNLILFVYLREGYRLSPDDVVYDVLGELSADKNVYSFEEFFNTETIEYRY